MKFSVNIPEAAHQKLMKKVVSLNKKAVKFNVPETTIEIVKEYFEEIKINNHKTGQFIKMIELEIDSFDVRLPDWTFIARRDHSYKTGIILTSMSDVEMLQEWREIPARCDHCNENRQRIVTYVVKHESTGEYKIVGSSCLKDFTQDRNIEKIIHLFTSISNLSKEFNEDDEHNKSRNETWWNIEQVLAITVALVEKYGYVKAGSEFGYPTASDARTVYLNLHRRDKENRLYDFTYSDANYETGKKVIEYIKSLTPNSDYIRNLHIILSGEFYNQRQHNILCSAVSVYVNHIQKEKIFKSEKVSEFFGEIGARFHNKPVTVVSTKSLGMGEFGMQYKIDFVDDTGHHFVWFTGKSDAYNNLTASQKLSIDGTVKKHSVYGNKNVTVLTRVKLIYSVQGTL